MKHLILLLVAATSLMAQSVGGVAVGGGGTGSGAPTDATYWLGSANGSLSAEIVVNDIASLEAAIAAYDFNDAANLTTGDIAAARMATNWGTAGTSACATTGGVMVDDASTVGCSADLTYASSRLTIGGAGGSLVMSRYSASDRFYMAAGGPVLVFDIGSGFWWLDGSSTSSALWLGGTVGAAGLSRTTNALQLYGDSKVLTTIGGSQTALFQDSTATTGITSVIVKGGAGQSTTDLMQWQDNAGNVLGRIASDGYGKLPAVQLVDPGAKPSCTSDTRGMIWYDAGGAGVADTAEICGKDAADAYAWVAIATF